MPIKKYFNSILALTFTGLLAATVYWAYQKNSDPNVKLPVGKPPLLLSAFTTGGSAQKILKVEVSFDEVKTDSEIVEIKAYVSLPFDYKFPLNYKWSFGPGVQLVEGLENGVLPELFAQQSKLISIKVRGFSKERNSHIRFDIHGVTNGQGIYGDALIASDIENTFENTVQNVERIKASE